MLTTETPVAAIEPGVGVRLEGGDRIDAEVVVANLDPKRIVALLDDPPADLAARADAWRSTSPVLKINCALTQLPTFPAAGGDPGVHRAQIDVGRSIDDTQAACVAARRGEPALEWCELYFQTVYDPSVAPPGQHTMSVFAQYVPDPAAGAPPPTAESLADTALATVARFAPDVTSCVHERQVLTPADVEARIGLTGGHIFQGEILPDQMWDRRFAARTVVPGLYLCGAATHPGGSVMARNGRNAARAVLEDLGATTRAAPAEA